jgi:hypothetical protein
MRRSKESVWELLERASQAMAESRIVLGHFQQIVTAMDQAWIRFLLDGKDQSFGQDTTRVFER